ncbi:MAG TPA: hypothetical protein VIS56_02010, partial [Candidatus Saccharimonadales bacterium]
EQPFVRKRLLELAKSDQDDRGKERIIDQNMTEAAWVQLMESDWARAREMLLLLEEIKLPSARHIGLDGSRAVWLIALHNVGYMDVGEIVLDRMKYLYHKDKSQVFYPGIPYLVDRLMVWKGEWQVAAKQLYGTQGYIDNEGVKRKFPVIDIAHLKDRRRKFELSSLGKCRHNNE